MKKLISSALAGNILEFYDFTLFGALSFIIGKTFFPETDPFNQILLTFATFSVGFLARPLGALIFGRIGDRLGRRWALSLSLIMMAVPTLVIALLPGYDVIGLFAPLILTLCRLIQGLCAGAEYNGAAIFLIEHLGPQRSGFASALISMAGTMGCLLAMAVSSLCLSPAVPSWSWRVAYLLGFTLAFVAYFIRHYIQESPTFLMLKRKHQTAESPLEELWSRYRSCIFISFFSSLICGTTAGLMVAFMPVFLKTHFHFPPHLPPLLQVYSMSCFVVAAPFWGLLSDQYTALKVLKWVSVCLVILSLPIFFLFSYNDTPCMMVGLTLLGTLASGLASPLNAFMVTLFPPQVRFTGVTLSYGLAMALTAGLTPLFLTYAMKLFQTPLFPGYYLGLMATISAVTLIFYADRQNLSQQEVSEKNIKKKKN